MDRPEETRTGGTRAEAEIAEKMMTIPVVTARAEWYRRSMAVLARADDADRPLRVPLW